jgi:hypothetical protein
MFSTAKKLRAGLFDPARQALPWSMGGENRHGARRPDQ